MFTVILQKQSHGAIAVDCCIRSLGSFILWSRARAADRPLSPRARERERERESKAEEERRRALKIGGLVVKLPQPREGRAARGSLATKVQRISCTMTSSSSTMPSSSSTGAPPEPLRAKLKRMATVLDAGGPTSLQKGHRGTHGKKENAHPCDADDT